MRVHRKSPSTSRELCRVSRQHATPEEQKLWRLLRGRQLLGFKFRRQEPIGNYVVDFFCHERRLIVELDGTQHDEPNRAYLDQQRDAYKSIGVQVLRFPNQLFRESPEAVVVSIIEASYQAISR